MRAVPKLGPAAVALEATGGFEAAVAAGLAGVGLHILPLNPAQVRATTPLAPTQALVAPATSPDTMYLRAA